MNKLRQCSSPSNDDTEAPLITFSGRNPSQNTHELRSFIRLLVNRGVRSFLEIGSRHGDSLHEIAVNLPSGSKIVGCDLAGGLWGTNKSRKYLERAIADLKKRGYEASCLFGDSTTLATARTLKARGPYDAILIDGSHVYEGVKRDWEIYGGWAPIVAFHDICGVDQAEKVHGHKVEVPRLWEEIKVGQHFVEYIDEGSRMGIGVILHD